MASHASKFLSDRVQADGVDKNVWVEFVGMAMKHKALNVGQGFPNFPPALHVMESLSAIPVENHMNNQYCRGFGHAPLVQALSDFYSPCMGRTIDPQTEFLVTVGAYYALYSVTQSFINAGDECIIMEPFFDCYSPMVTYAGGTPRFIALNPKGESHTANDWCIDFDKLEEMINPKTKMIILNNPNNPLGKVWSQAELEKLAEICIRRDILCISDEVYEHLVYAPQKMIRIASFPGMWERTITIGSAGKTWSATGWKIGWAYGPQELINPMHVVWQNSIYTAATPLQEACARAFKTEMSKPFDGHPKDNPASYFRSLCEDELRPKKEKMTKILQDVGLNPIVPDGGYFMIADMTPLTKFIDEKELDSTNDPWDYKVVRWLCEKYKIATIPNSAFYSAGHKKDYEKYIRFCFAKDDNTLDQFGEEMRRHFS
jgi:kynurenine--oxoglutarate transaminase/cysteine-S-conjugate beta-lyase/glutamine--phenylpyruvate transaminase